MTRLRLVIFDVDGTLVDSQGAILGAMAQAFAEVEQPMPAQAEVLAIVGLSLDAAMLRLAPEQDEVTRAAMVAAYRAAFRVERAQSGASRTAPFYPGMRALLDRLQARDDLLLGVATGKSARGLNALIAAHGLERCFVTRQTADHHPSKPHPSMIEAALSETGVAPRDAVMIGDTTFDLDMAHAAGVPAIGVGWGYHPVTALRPLTPVVARDAAGLQAALDAVLEHAA